MDFAAMKPADLRGLIRKGELTGPTTGMCNGYAQGNLVVLPKALAWDFLLFCQRNPKACPLLEVADAGERTFAQFGKGSDIATDIPRYRVYEHGELTGEYTDVSKFFEERNDLVSFLIGCSFSFESELLEAGIPVRQIEEGVNVPMYNTNIPCTPAGVFSLAGSASSASASTSRWTAASFNRWSMPVVSRQWATNAKNFLAFKNCSCRGASFRSLAAPALAF